MKSLRRRGSWRCRGWSKIFPLLATHRLCDSADRSAGNTAGSCWLLFSKLPRTAAMRPATDIAYGVYESLLTSIASPGRWQYPAFVAYSYLSARVNTIIHEMERAGIEILAILDEVRRRNKPVS